MNLLSIATIAILTIFATYLAIVILIFMAVAISHAAEIMSDKIKEHRSE